MYRSDNGYRDMIAACEIFAKYAPETNRPFHCEHDTLYAYGVDPDDVSKEDIAALDGLGFFPLAVVEGFMSFRFGSC